MAGPLPVQGIKDHSLPSKKFRRNDERVSTWTVMRSFREADASKAYREASANIFAMAAYALGLEADELCATHIYE